MNEKITGATSCAKSLLRGSTNARLLTLTGRFAGCPLSVAPACNGSSARVALVTLIVHHRVYQVEVSHLHRILYRTRVSTRNYKVKNIIKDIIKMTEGTLVG